MFSIRFLLIVSILATFANSVLSIKCYRCESDNIENCGESFDAEGILLDDCSKVPPPRHLMHILGPNRNASGCAKILAERYGRSVIIRSCYFGDINNTEQGCTPNPAEIGISYKTCKVCADDGCNGSRITGPIAVLVLISAFIPRIFAK